MISHAPEQTPCGAAPGTCIEGLHPSEFREFNVRRLPCRMSRAARLRQASPSLERRPRHRITGMALRPVMVNVKALDALAVGRFWAEALGWTAYRGGATTYVGPPGGLVWPDPVVLG